MNSLQPQKFGFSIHHGLISHRKIVRGYLFGCEMIRSYKHRWYLGKTNKLNGFRFLLGLGNKEWGVRIDIWQ